MRQVNGLGALLDIHDDKDNFSKNPRRTGMVYEESAVCVLPARLR
jgi:hypothetical protein